MASKGTLRIQIIGDAKSFKGALGEVSDAIPGWAKGIGAAVGGAGLLAGGLFADRLLGAIDRERLNDKLAASLGMSGQDADRIAKVASDVYADAWGDSIEEVHAAIGTVAQEFRGVAESTGDDLKDMTSNALAIAGAFDVDVTEAVRTASVMMRNGLARDAEHAFDIITKGFETGANRSDDLLESFNEYSEPLSSLGLDGERAIGAINSALDDGIWNADKLLDAVKEFSIRVIEDSPAVSQAFSDLELDMDELQAAIAEGGPTAEGAVDKIVAALGGITDPLARERAGVALFGTMWEDVGGDVILNALDPIKASIGEVDGATDRMAENVEGNLATSWTSFTRTAGEAFNNWAQVHILPRIADVQAAMAEDGLGGALKKMHQLWEDAWPDIKDWLENVLAPALVKWAKGVGSAIGQAMLNAAMDKLASLPGILGNIPGIGAVSGGVGGLSSDIANGVAGIITGNGGSGSGAEWRSVGGGPSNTTVNVNMPPQADPNDVIRIVRQWEQRNGTAPIAGVIP